MAEVLNVSSGTYATGLGTAGQISNRTAAWAVAKFLQRATPLLVFEKFGQTFVMPTNATKVARFRRYEALAATPNELVEGVTPAAKTLRTFDVECQLKQYGDLIIITDVVNDTNEDPVLDQAVQVLAEQAALMIENVRFGVLMAGTNVDYSGAAGAVVAGRDNVQGPITLKAQRRILRGMKNQLARPITSYVKSTPNYATQSISPAFIGICHPDCEVDIRTMTGFIDAKDYGSTTPMEGEVGYVEGVRYIASTVVEPVRGAGSTTVTGLLNSGDTPKVDVYPIFYIAADSYGLVPLKGKNAITPTVLNPGTPSKSDPLGQRGYVGWKSMQTAVILNDAWLCRAEVGVTSLA